MQYCCVSEQATEADSIYVQQSCVLPLDDHNLKTPLQNNVNVP